MGSLTLSGFRTELLFNLGNRVDTGTTNEARLNRWINDAYLFATHPSVHLVREAQTITTITLVSGDYDYDISSTGLGFQINAIRWVSYVEATAFTPTARRRKLRPRNIRWLEERTLPLGGQPTNYSIDGELLYVSPVPSTAEAGNLLRVGVYREVVSLSADGDRTALGTTLDRPILKLAEGFAMWDLGYRDTAREAWEHAQDLLNNIEPEVELEAEDTGNQVEFILSQPGGLL